MTAHHAPDHQQHITDELRAQQDGDEASSQDGRGKKGGVRGDECVSTQMPSDTAIGTPVTARAGLPAQVGLGVGPEARIDAPSRQAQDPRAERPPWLREILSTVARSHFGSAISEKRRYPALPRVMVQTSNGSREFGTLVSASARHRATEDRVIRHHAGRVHPILDSSTRVR